MPDISMCQNETCQLRIYCYRFTAKPNEVYQSYTDFRPSFDNHGWFCKHFIELKVVIKNSFTFTTKSL